MLKWLILIISTLFSIVHLQAQAPVADFTMSTTQGCAPLSVRFTNTSTGNPTEFYWSFSNGVFSEQINPTVTFSSAGVYDVHLVVRNANGTSEKILSQVIVVDASPTARFSPQSLISCLPSNISFTDQSTPHPNGGAITRWEWDFGNGVTSTERNPSVTYTESGFYTTRLRVYSENDCAAQYSVSNNIRILNGITPSFRTSDPLNCNPPFNIQFTDQTIAPGELTYRWQFPDGSTSTAKNPNYRFSTGGPQRILLTVNSSYGCSQTLDTTININFTPTDFTIPENICINTPVTFTNVPGADLISSQWVFSNGVTSLDVNATVSFATPGTYQVTLNNAYANCLSEVTKTITVTAPPSFDFNATNLIGCEAPFTTNFTATSTGASYLWDFGDGNTSTLANPSHTYQSPGIYTVKLIITNENGCSTTVEKAEYIKIQIPTIQINNLPRGLCVGESLNLTATPISLDPITTINWELVGVRTATGNAFTATINNEGTYTLNLSATTQTGCVVNLEETILAGTPPTPIIVEPLVDTICPSSPTPLIGDVAPPHNTGITYSWKINGNIVTGNNIPYNFSDTGTTTIELTAFHNFCASNTVDVTSLYVKRPIAHFESNYDCNDNTFRFVNTSLVRATDNATYLWNFGNNASIQTSTDRVPPPVKFNGLGNHTVSLTVTIDDCTHTFSDIVSLVNETAQIEMVTPNICVNQQTIFRAKGNPLNIIKFEWSVNGSPYEEGGRDFVYTFTTFEEHSVKLRITDINNCTKETTLENLPSYQPISKFRPSIESGCQGLNVEFHNESSSSNSTITRYLWNFGDGTSSTEANPIHRYLNTGSYPTELTVWDDKSCSNTYLHTGNVRISGLQSAFITDSDIICPDVELPFVSTTVGSEFTYLWDFGGQGTSNEPNPSFRFSGEQENYLVKLTITDTFGCESISEKNIQVKLPTVKIDAVDKHSICIPLETRFEQTATNYRNLIWDFGDNSEATLENPSHFYNDYGVYKARLTAEGYGCSVSDSIQVVLTDIDDTRLNYHIIDRNNLQACVNDIGVFEGTVTPGTYWTWNIAGTQYDTVLNFEHKFLNYGDYTPEVILRDSIGCIRRKSMGSRIQILGSRVIFDLDKDQHCDQGMVTFRDFSLISSRDVLQRHVWDFGDGTPTVEGKSASHNYSQPGTYIVQKYVYTNFCENVERDTVRVYRTPEPIINSADFVCVDNRIQFIGDLMQADTAITWTWRVGNSVSPTKTSTLFQQFTSAGTVNIKLTAETENKCIGETEKNVEVIPLPNIDFTTNPVTLILGDQTSIPVVYDKPDLKYTWFPNTSLSCSDCAVPITSTKQDINYNVLVEDEYGCRANNDISIKVICADQNVFIPNTFSPNGDGRNDIFLVRGKELTMIKSMRIFNRWGQLVFHKSNVSVNDPSVGWDGTFNGKPASPDVYIYTIEIVCENGATIPISGNITLLR